MWQTRSKMIFFSSVFIAGLTLSQMLIYVLQQVFDLRLAYNLIDICNSWLRSLDIAWTEYLFDALIVYTLFLCVFLLGRQMIQSKHISKKLTAHRDEQHTTFIGGQYGQDVIVIRHSQPFAFTLGLFKPSIFLSTGLMELLDDHELEAVIYHERFHKEHKDPLKMFLLSMFSSAMAYFPILKWCHQHYKTSREVLADDYAMSVQGSSLYLGGALLKLLKRTNRKQIPITVSAFADTSINCRIRRILDPQTDIPLKIPMSLTIASITVFVLLSAFFIILA